MRFSPRVDCHFQGVSSRVMELAGLVEAQARQAVHALATLDAEAANAVVLRETLVDQLEICIDRELSSMMGRRQPRAGDLRLLEAMSRTTANLERVGDEADCIARSVQSIVARGEDGSAPSAGELRFPAEMATGQLRRALDALVRLDTDSAVSVLQGDRALDREFGEFLARIAARMSQQPRMVPSGVDLVIVAQAIERIGDHAKNIAECIIYVVSGTDVRHGGDGARGAAARH